MELDALSAGNTEGTGEPTELHRKLSKSSLSRHASEGMGVFPLRDMSDKNTIGHFTAKMTFRENVTGIGVVRFLNFNYLFRPYMKIYFGLEARSWQTLALRNLSVWTD